MFKFLQTRNGLIITAVIVLLLVLIVTYNWGQIKGWFQGMSEGRTGAGLEDCYCNGKYKGRMRPSDCSRKCEGLI